MRTMRALAAMAAAAAGAAGCGDASSYDPFPIAVDLSGGPVMAAAGEAEGAPVDAVIDTGALFSVVDDFAPGVEDREPHRREIDLHLYAAGGTVARASFGGAAVFDLHPCERTDGPCEVGIDDARRELRMIVGADVLSRAAVRFDFPASQLRFFPDVAGDDSTRARACDAVFPGAITGGGTLRLGDSEIAFGARRLAVGACLAYDAETPAPAVRGADALFVVATGLPISVISSGAWERYRAVVADDAVAPPLASLPAITVHLSWGPMPARLASINRMALLAEGTGASEERGPCLELYAHHVMADEVCDPADDSDACSDCGEANPANGPCPCPDRDNTCAVSAGIEIDRSFPVAVVDELDPAALALLQSLRFELRPELPDVDGLLAPSALGPLQLDIDYPNGRLVTRCGDPTGCVTRPQLGGSESVREARACLGL